MEYTGPKDNDPRRYQRKPEFRNWQALHNASEATKARRCVVCGEPMEGAIKHWFLKQYGNPAGVVHGRCAVVNVAEEPSYGVKRVAAEPVETPTKLWELQDDRFSSDPWASVGYGPQIDDLGHRGVRVEMHGILFSGAAHKRRRVLSKKLTPRMAVALGQALVEAGEQAIAGQTPATKRSDD